MIQNFNDFVNSLLDAGFSMSGGNSEGIFSVIPCGWDEEPPYATPVRWFTGDPETDPWEWRIRVLEERNDIAYAKLFFRKGGYITKEWYPYFLAVRRGGKELMDEYEDGTISRFAKRIYDIILENEPLPFHVIKQIGSFSKEDSSRFERTLVELQMKMYLTICGRQQKFTIKGEEYGWPSTVFCTVENYFGKDVIEKANKISELEAIEKITRQIYRLNPAADSKKIIKFIKG
ncbi:MAG TPA: hypothetical protein GXX20_00040 [Clostridiaceae bacterium]|nr:hypothetical protein [Clostridiaceae bacterium]